MAHYDPTSLPLPTGPEDLPFYFDFPGIPDRKVCLDEVQKSHLPELYALWDDVISRGDGFGEGEDFSFVEEKIINQHDPYYIGHVLTDPKTSKVIAANFFIPSALCRSENPIHCSGYVLVHQEYRGRRIANYMMLLFLPFASDTYQNFLGRTNVIGKNIRPNMRAGSHFLGIIPWCTYLAGQGWFHDNISFSGIEPKWKTAQQSMEKVPTISSLKDKDILETCLPTFRRPEPSLRLPSLYHNSFGRMLISFANSVEIWDIQDIIRQSAETGDAFGLDELTVNGLYNEKLLRNCNYWVVRKESNKELLAIILSGDSGICRSHNRKQAAGVIVVLKPFRKQGLGDQLLRFCEAQAPLLGYEYILTDVLACNTAGLSLMRKHKFVITGTFPQSCFVKGYAYTDCFLHWKPLKHQISSSNL